MHICSGLRSQVDPPPPTRPTRTALVVCSVAFRPKHKLKRVDSQRVVCHWLPLRFACTMLAKAQAAAAQAAQQAREAAERAAKQGTEALADARNKASTLDTDTLMGNAVEGLESRLSGSFAKVSQLAEKSATSPMPSVGPASSTPKKRALDNLQREVSTGRHTPRWPISRSRTRCHGRNSWR